MAKRRSPNGYRKFPVIGQIKILDLVDWIRRFRGRLSYRDILHELKIPVTRYNWLKIYTLCKDYEIVTADPVDPDYYRSTIRAEQAQMRRDDRQKRRKDRKKHRAMLQAARDLQHTDLPKEQLVQLAIQAREQAMIDFRQKEAAKLALEIAAAKAEAHKTKPFKQGNLEW